MFKIPLSTFFTKFKVNQYYFKVKKQFKCLINAKSPIFVIIYPTSGINCNLYRIFRVKLNYTPIKIP